MSSHRVKVKVSGKVAMHRPEQSGRILSAAGTLGYWSTLLLKASSIEDEAGSHLHFFQHTALPTLVSRFSHIKLHSQSNQKLTHCSELSEPSELQRLVYSRYRVKSNYKTFNPLHSRGLCAAGTE